MNGVSEAEQQIRSSTDAAVGAERENSAPAPTEYTLKNGITFKLKPVSGLLIRRAATQVIKPEVPMWLNPDRGREEPNPNHPDYIHAMELYDEAIGMAAMNVLYMVGTKLVEPLPDGVEGPDSDAWIEELKFFEIEVRTEGPGRYLDWLKYVALADTEDFMGLTVAAGRLAGLQEGDVLGVLGSFRRGEARGADSGGAPAGEDAGDGDSLQPASAESGAGD